MATAGTRQRWPRRHELTKFEGRSLTVHHASSGGDRADPHAGYRETSLMLHLEPAAVRTDLLAAGDTRALVDLLPQLQSGGIRQISGTGAGYPTGATGEEGRRIFAEMLAAVTARAGQLLDS